MTHSESSKGVDAMSSTCQAHIICLCGSVRELGEILGNEKFPVDSHLCHCDDCRYVTGSLFYSLTRLRSEPSAKSLSHCTRYETSDTLLRYFCTECGCHCFVEFREKDVWWVGTGMIDPGDEKTQSRPDNVIKVTEQLHVGDTVDYQLVSRLHTIGGRATLCYNQDPEEPPLSNEQLLHPPTPPVATPKQFLEGRCHCGSVQLKVPRPKEDTKYGAGFCVCRSCRLSIGCASAVPWVSFELDGVLNVDGEVIRFGPDGPTLPGLRNYSSSPEKVVWSFCSTCGASVFYWNARKVEIDVAVGVMRAPEGDMASDWFAWNWEIVYHEEEQVDRELVAALYRRE